MDAVLKATTSMKILAGANIFYFLICPDLCGHVAKPSRTETSLKLMGAVRRIERNSPDKAIEPHAQSNSSIYYIGHQFPNNQRSITVLQMVGSEQHNRGSTFKLSMWWHSRRIIPLMKSVENCSVLLDLQK
ncbi:hypothetical protein TNCT_259141 [Trichonephila clavata]|uniref:Uncharacterized protein n=1 Tax=Trichonephila clavata TaxID=2740835 RepID=A0A8X6LF56_TRICU|nr:hypothetical protein TNCT_259141 [Trichonephila clavata]